MDVSCHYQFVPLIFVLKRGWHRRTNGRAGRPDLGFKVLVPLLSREAETVDLTIRLVSEHALTRVHRKIFKEVHGGLFEIREK
ncbi:hypothetical protein DPMN_020703 [Dreissena polymorpha]|uniref:Uncharacterized protein n=1 Tax=Dreissena polymorpha TaxID=45954 RepID=A0A9D4NKS1_DREPO|nr:hypothetical protein DPMN_020703 [Dreissena polymorpha]